MHPWFVFFSKPKFRLHVFMFYTSLSINTFILYLLIDHVWLALCNFWNVFSNKMVDDKTSQSRVSTAQCCGWFWVCVEAVLKLFIMRWRRRLAQFHITSFRYCLFCIAKILISFHWNALLDMWSKKLSYYKSFEKCTLTISDPCVNRYHNFSLHMQVYLSLMLQTFVSFLHLVL